MQMSPVKFALSLALLIISSSCFAQVRAFTDSEERVLQAYVAYYGRPADAGGLAYWAGRLEEEGGSLASIIDAFGESQEYQERFGGLSNEELIANLYQQLFGRGPDPEGKTYWAGQLKSGAQSLQKISLSILDGAQNDDTLIINNRVSFSKYYVTATESEKVQPLDADGLAELMASVDEMTDSVLTANDVLNGRAVWDRFAWGEAAWQ